MNINNLLYRSWLNSSGENPPAVVSIEPTMRCNMNCLMCDRTYKNNYKQYLENELKLDVILENIQIMGQMGVSQILLIGGGEPLLRKDIGIILKEIKKSGMKSHLWTNGTLFNSDNYNDILPYVDFLTISLDSSDEQEHDTSRGVKGSYSKIINSLKLIGEYRSSIYLRIHTVISKINYRNLDSLIGFAKKYHIKEIGGGILFPFDFVPSEMSFKENEKAELDENIKRFKAKAIQEEINLAGSFKHIFKDLLDEAIVHHNIISATKDGTSCFGLWSMATIKPNGDVNVCCFTEKPKLGKLTENNFKEIWNSETARKYRIAAKKGEHFDSPCKGCDLGRHVLTDIMQQCEHPEEILNSLVLNSR